MESKKRKNTLWIEFLAKPVRQELEASKSGAAAEEAMAGFKTLVDALYKGIAKRNRRDGSGERAALFDIKAQIRSVYPNLSFDAKPSTVAKFVKRLVIDLAEERRAHERLKAAVEDLHIRMAVKLQAHGIVDGPLSGLGWKPDPEKAPETVKSSPQLVQTTHDALVDLGQERLAPIPEIQVVSTSIGVFQSSLEEFGKAGSGG